MKIVEQFVQGKTQNPDECEDGIFVNEYFVAVVDGASSKTQKLYDGKKTGRIARDVVLSALAEVVPDVDARALMHRLNSAVYAWYESQGIVNMVSAQPFERCSASVAVYSVHAHELWMVSDCHALVDGVHIQNTKHIDAVSDEARAAFLEAELRKGVTIESLRQHDTGREFIRPLLDRQNYFQNVDGGSVFDYEVIDGFFTDSQPIKIVPIAVGAKEVVIATDGYPELKRTLDASEAALTTVLRDDPLLFKTHRSPKGYMQGNNSYDDRAYVRLTP